jgi:hypothetical protein
MIPNTPRADVQSDGETPRSAIADPLTNYNSLLPSPTLELERRIQYLERQLALTHTPTPRAELDLAFEVAARNVVSNDISMLDTELEGEAPARIQAPPPPAPAATAPSGSLAEPLAEEHAPPRAATCVPFSDAEQNSSLQHPCDAYGHSDTPCLHPATG